MNTCKTSVHLFIYSFIHWSNLCGKSINLCFPCQSTQEKCYKTTQEVNETWLFSCWQWRHCSSASTLHQTIILSDKHIIVALICYSMFNSCYSFFLFHITIEISKKSNTNCNKERKNEMNSFIDESLTRQIFNRQPFQWRNMWLLMQRQNIPSSL